MNQHSFRHIVVMGVSGSGKTTVGEALSPLVGLESVSYTHLTLPTKRIV